PSIIPRGVYGPRPAACRRRQHAALADAPKRRGRGPGRRAPDEEEREGLLAAGNDRLGGALRARAGDLDLARARALRLRQRQGEHAVLEVRLGLVGIDRAGERERPAERADAALAQVPALALLGLG